MDYTFQHSIHVLVCEGVVHGEADDEIGETVGIGEVGGRCRRQAAIGGELADERIEIAATENVRGFHLEIEFVAGHTILLCINQNREIRTIPIVVLRRLQELRFAIEKRNTFDILQGSDILLGNLFAGSNSGIYIAQVEQAIRCTHLVHLGVDARGDDRHLVVETEVLQVINTALGFRIGHNHCTALDGIVHLGGMETERTHIACFEDRLAVHFHAESVGGIVDNFESVGIGNMLNTLGITGLTIDVNRHDSRSMGRDSRLNLIGIHIARLGVDIHKDGFDTIPPKGVRGSDKRIRCSNHLARNTQRLQTVISGRVPLVNTEI